MAGLVAGVADGGAAGWANACPAFQPESTIAVVTQAASIARRLARRRVATKLCDINTLLASKLAKSIIRIIAQSFRNTAIHRRKAMIPKTDALSIPGHSVRMRRICRQNGNLPSVRRGNLRKPHHRCDSGQRDSRTATSVGSDRKKANDGSVFNSSPVTAVPLRNSASAHRTSAR